MVSLLTDYQQSSLGWQESYLKIIDKSAKLISLVHNIAQLKVHNTALLQQSRDLPVRLITCKARQEGVSTYEEASIFEDVNRKPNRHACVISVDQDSTNKVFKMCKTFQAEMPDHMRRDTIASNRKEIAYVSPHRSSIICQTAGKEVIGRGGTTHRVHATEVAFWEHAEEQLYGLLQEVPLIPDSRVHIESTAFGTTGAFHDRFWTAVDFLRAQEGKKNPDYNGYLPVFLPWHIFPEYTMPLPEGYTFTAYSDHEYFGDEQYLVSKYRCTPEQLYWRRYKITNDFDNNLSLFKQEYPANARESFQGTGRMVFSSSKVDMLERLCKPPRQFIEFYMDDNTVCWRNVNKRENCWAVWKWPQKNHDYIIFGDVAEGVLADKANVRSEPDRSVAGVLDRREFDIPMVYYGRPDTIEYADQMLMAAKFFNHAWASPEMNSIGQSVLDTFKRDGYSNIYSRETKEDTDNTEDSQHLGWKTTIATRKPMIADLITVVNEGDIKIYDRRIIDEMRTFIYNKVGKPEADSNKHDDCVMMLAGLIQLHQRCPLYNDEDYNWADKQTHGKAPLSVAGAVDTLDDEINEYDLMYSSSEEFND